MRNLVKVAEPEVLVNNHSAWDQAFQEDHDSPAKRYRYRDPDIKKSLLEETGSKCVYCESKVGHNTPGDVEHKVPTSADVTLHFAWQNLTIACTECNRRKNKFFSASTGFLDPYTDNVEAALIHFGPLVFWRNGDIRAEVTVKKLELNKASRVQLILRKTEKLNEVRELLARHEETQSSGLKAVLKAQVAAMAEKTAEYSAMVIAALRQMGFDGFLA